MNTSFKDLIPKYDIFMFDCDGVLWSGGKPIPGAFETLQELEKIGKKVFFISNSANKTREDSIDKMAKLGYKGTAKPE